MQIFAGLLQKLNRFGSQFFFALPPGAIRVEHYQDEHYQLSTPTSVNTIRGSQHKSPVPRPSQAGFPRAQALNFQKRTEV